MTTDETGEFTTEQLAKMDSRDLVALLRRNSGDANFYWRVREAVLNRAANEIERLTNGLQQIADGVYTEKGAEDWAKLLLRRSH